MARMFGRCTTGIVATSTSAKTIIQIVAPTNQRVAIWDYSISLDGSTSTNAPSKIRILRQTTAGTFSNATNAPLQDDKGLTETFQTNYQTVATAEPTAGDVLRDIYIPAYNGYYEPPARVDGQPLFVIQGGGRLGFEATAATGTPNIKVDVLIEE